MKKQGHIIFALIVIFLGAHLLNNFTKIEIPTNFIILHIPFLLVGALILDKAEPIKFYGDINHKKALHGWFFLSVVIIEIYFSYNLYLSYPKEYLFSIAGNIFSVILFFLIGLASHNLIDHF